MLPFRRKLHSEKCAFQVQERGQQTRAFLPSDTRVEEIPPSDWLTLESFKTNFPKICTYDHRYSRCDQSANTITSCLSCVSPCAAVCPAQVPTSTLFAGFGPLLLGREELSSKCEAAAHLHVWNLAPSLKTDQRRTPSMTCLLRTTHSQSHGSR